MKKLIVNIVLIILISTMFLLLCGCTGNKIDKNQNADNQNNINYTKTESIQKQPSGTSENLKDVPFQLENSNSGYAVFSKSGNNAIMNIYVGAKENPDLEIGSETTAILEYDVSKFSSFTCTLISKNVLDNNEARLRIYGDGELIYESLKMQSGNSVNIDMDISKYNTLKFEAVAKVDEKYNKKGLFTLKAAKLWY